jgi:hypothetical protein
MVYLALACRVLVGVTFFAAVLGKVRSAEAFRLFTASLAGLGWLSAERRRPVAVATTAAELSIVALVAWSPTARGGLAIAAVAVGVFTIVMIAAERRGAPVTCRCFGGGGQTWGPVHLIRNTLLGGSAVLGVVAHSIAPPGQPALAGATVASAVAAIVALLLILSDDLAYLFSSDRRLT